MSVVPRDRHRLPHPRRKAGFLRVFLADDIGLETPDAPAILELRTRVDARRARPAIGNLAGIRRQSDVDVHVAGIVERDVLFGMTAAYGEAVDDDFGRARWPQLSRREFEAPDVCRRGVVQVSIAQFESGAAHRAELFAHHVNSSVAVRIAQSDD